jgi:hypothetical protein
MERLGTEVESQMGGDDAGWGATAQVKPDGDATMQVGETMQMGGDDTDGGR